MGTKEILLNIWRETRTTINHIDSMMDSIRVRTFTLFGTISSIAAALNYWAPDIIVSGIPLPAIVELIIIPVIIILYAQNRMYHYWLYRSVETATIIEGLLYEELKYKIKDRNAFITYSLTGLDEPRKGYWRSMFYSKIFWVDFMIFIFLIIICLGLSFMFGFHLTFDQNYP